MYPEAEHGGRRIPTLVQYCQRVASAHVNSFERLGDGWPEELIRPILNSCSAETLWRLEEQDPYIAEYTDGIWKTICQKAYPTLFQPSGPESWKEEYARCKEEHEMRLQKAAANLREKRQRDEERRKETSIKITDQLPQPKRARWGGPAPQKTLFQKTRSEAAKLQKGVFGVRMARQNFQRRTVVSSAASAKPPPPPASSSSATGSRVVVRTVTVPRKPLPTNAAASALVEAGSGARMSAVLSSPAPSAACPPASSPPTTSSPQITESSDSRSPPPPPLRPPPKKNPASSLFMPKHRAHSQLPRGVQSKS